MESPKKVAIMNSFFIFSFPAIFANPNPRTYLMSFGGSFHKCANKCDSLLISGHLVLRAQMTRIKVTPQFAKKSAMKVATNAGDEAVVSALRSSGFGKFGI